MRSLTIPLALATLAVGGTARADDVSQGATYHADAARSGNYVVPGLTWATAATMRRIDGFAGTTTGNVNNQPLYWRAPGAAHGIVVVATDQNVVQAFDAVGGASVWRTALGPVDLQGVPNCGPPREQGVYSTPVIDPAAGILYAIGSFRDKNGNDQYGVWALSLSDGSVRPGWPLVLGSALGKFGMPFNTIIHDQRGALSLVGGRVYAGFAANSGDCGTYHGWVVGIDTATATVAGAWRARAIRAGVWATGGVVTDGTSLFATTGNAFESSGWADGEAVFRFTPALTRPTDAKDYFVPSDFKALDDADYDLGGSSPLPVDLPMPGGGTAQWLLQIGKGGVAYVLDRANLGGIGGALAGAPVAQPPVVVTGAAYPTASGLIFAFPATGTHCPGGGSDPGMVALDVSATPSPSVTTRWCAPQGSLGTPMATTSNGRAYPIVWVTTATKAAFMLGFNGNSGKVVATIPAQNDCLATIPRHETILAAEGRLFVGAQGRVCAFGFTPGG